MKGYGERHHDETMAVAKDEVTIMRALAEEPRSAMEIELTLGMPRNRVAYILTGLRAAGCVYRVPGTHLQALT